MFRFALRFWFSSLCLHQTLMYSTDQLKSTMMHHILEKGIYLKVKNILKLHYTVLQGRAIS